MIEAIGDLWTYPCDARCITTCGVVKANGELVMGAGVAKQAVILYPFLPKRAGDHVLRYGNVPYGILINGVLIVTFPTKHNWKDKSDLALITHSATRVIHLVQEAKTIAITRPGCGLGGLDWEKEVKPAIKDILDDRFVILTPK